MENLFAGGGAFVGSVLFRGSHDATHGGLAGAALNSNQLHAPPTQQQHNDTS